LAVVVVGVPSNVVALPGFYAGQGKVVAGLHFKFWPPELRETTLPPS
jgi:hypothetical protein